MAALLPEEMAKFNDFNDPQYGEGSGQIPPGAEKFHLRAQEVNMPLDEQALKALAGLPSDHAVELLEGTIEKRDTLRNPSSYITSIVSRGFVPRSGKGYGKAGPSVGEALSAADLAARGVTSIWRLQDMGVELTDEALRALSTLPAEHAAEIVDFVADSPQGHFRDPSNYIASTVARGFVSRRGNGSSPPMGVYEGGGKGEGHYGSGGKGDSHYGGAGSGGGGGYGGGGGGSPAPWRGSAPAAAVSAPPPAPMLSQSMIPHDVSSLEMRIMQLNAMNLWKDLQIDLPSYLALRCVPQHQALEILDAMEAKSKFTGISSPCNYVQATIAKIQKGLGKGNFGKSKSADYSCGKGKADSLNTTGNLSGQRAAELGLSLSQDAHHALAAMALRDAFQILDGAVQAAATGADASDYIVRATSSRASEPPVKRPRMW